MSTAAALITILISVTSLVGAIVGVVIALRKAPAETRLINSQAADTLTDTAISLIQPLRDEIEDLKQKSAVMEKKIDSLETLLAGRDLHIVKLSEDIRRRDILIEELVRGIGLLIEQLSAAKISPVWTPNIAILKLNDAPQ